MRKFFAVFFIAILALSFTLSAFAADMPYKASEKKGSGTTYKKGSGTTEYPAGPIQKLERGIGNVAFGWSEIPKRIVDKTKESNPIKGLVLGLFQGTCKAFARTVSGAGDIVTFPFGGYDKPGVIPDMPAAE